MTDPIFLQNSTLQAALQTHVPLVGLNTFGVVARARQFLDLTTPELTRAFANEWAAQGSPSVNILGAGSNLVITGDVKPLVVHMATQGRRVIDETESTWELEAEAGENWHDFVTWAVDQGHPGLENLALIPGTVGAAPVQNVGAYGLEVKDRMTSLDWLDLRTGVEHRLDAKDCRFGYRDSIFKDTSAVGLAGHALITRVRFRLKKRWVREIGYADLQKKAASTGHAHPGAREVFDWVCQIRSTKLPDWRVMGNAGSFFKNPTVSADLCTDIIAREPKLVHYPLADGSFKLAAAWLIDACDWRGKSVGNAAVHDRHALVIVNKGGATGGEVMTLAKAIQTSVYERFGIRLQPEPVVW